MASTFSTPMEFRSIAEEAGVWDQLVAAYRTDTLIGAGAEALSGQTLDPQSAVELENVWAELTPTEKANAELFADVQTMDDLVAARAQIAREALLAQQLESGPLNPLVASLIAQVAAPENWLPFTAPVRGAGALRGALTVGGRVALETAAVEGVLHQLQRTRTFSESVAAVTMSAALGGAIGGVLGRGVNVDSASKLFGRDLAELQASATKEHQADIERALAGEGPRGSVGAAFNDELGSTATRLDPADTVIVPTGKLNRGLAKVLRAAGLEERALRMEDGQFGYAETLAQLKRLRLAPVGLELMTSPFPAVREYAMRLADTGVDTAGVAAGRATGFDPVQLRIRFAVQSAALLQRRIFAANYAEHVRLARAAGAKPMSKTQFSEEISKALRRDTAHVDPAVDAAAKAYRSEIITPTGKMAAETKLNELDEATGDYKTLLPDFLLKDKKFADRYLTRVYDKGNIRRHGKEWRDLLRAYLRQAEDTADLEPAEIEDLIEMVTDRILNGNPVINLDVPVKTRQPRKMRALRIDDTLLDSVRLQDGQTISFLKNNVDEVTARYVALMASDIEFARAFGKTDPGVDMAQAIKQEANRAAEKAATASEREAIIRRGTREANLIEEMVAQVRQLANPVSPEYTVGARILNSYRQFNFMNLLGLSGVSSMPDAGRVIMMHGFRRSHGVLMRDMQNGFRTFKASKKMLARSGEAADMEIAFTAKNLNDLGTGTSELTLVERGLERGATIFSNLNLMNMWNQTMKRFAGSIVIDSIMEAAEKVARGVPLSKTELRDMAASNLTLEDLRGFAQEFELGLPENRGAVAARVETQFLTEAGEAKTLSGQRFLDPDSAKRYADTRAAFLEEGVEVRTERRGDDLLLYAGGRPPEVFRTTDTPTAGGREVGETGLGPKIAQVQTREYGAQSAASARTTSYSDVFDNVRFTDYSAWQDRKLAAKLEAALGRAVGDLVITPGVADAPLWGNKEWGKSVLQFKKFGFASNQRTTIRAIQRGNELAVYQGLTIMLALGAFVTYVRMALAGRLEEYFEMDTDELILNAVDRSGMVPLVLELDNQFGAFFGRNNNLSGILTGASPQKFSARGWLTNLMGPTTAHMNRTFDAFSYARQGPIDAADWNRAVGLLPGQNLPILSHILDAGAQELGR